MLFIFVDGTACTEDGIQLYTKGPQKGHINSSTFHYRFYSVFCKKNASILLNLLNESASTAEAYCVETVLRGWGCC